MDNDDGITKMMEALSAATELRETLSVAITESRLQPVKIQADWLRDRCRALLDATQSGWLPIETAPTDGTVIHGWNTVTGHDFMLFREDRWWVDAYGFERMPTHWKPVDAPIILEQNKEK